MDWRHDFLGSARGGTWWDCPRRCPNPFSLEGNVRVWTIAIQLDVRTPASGNRIEALCDFKPPDGGECHHANFNCLHVFEFQYEACGGHHPGALLLVHQHGHATHSLSGT